MYVEVLVLCYFRFDETIKERMLNGFYSSRYVHKSVLIRCDEKNDHFSNIYFTIISESVKI